MKILKKADELCLSAFCVVCFVLPPSYSFLYYHASYWKVKSIFLGREKRHFT